MAWPARLIYLPGINFPAFVALGTARPEEFSTHDQKHDCHCEAEIGHVLNLFLAGLGLGSFASVIVDRPGSLRGQGGSSRDAAPRLRGRQRVEVP
jgi:hypothetical protein